MGTRQQNNNNSGGGSTTLSSWERLGDYVSRATNKGGVTEVSPHEPHVRGPSPRRRLSASSPRWASTSPSFARAPTQIHFATPSSPSTTWSDFMRLHSAERFLVSAFSCARRPLRRPLQGPTLLNNVNNSRSCEHSTTLRTQKNTNSTLWRGLNVKLL